MSVFVFVGPTLAPAEVQRELPAVCLPPASQGDVYRVALQKPRAIGIIDGYFQRVPAVWHKEILWAMEQGIHVYGSASMGALRAAELAAFGMTGVGTIFEQYRDGLLEDDDEVAVAHADSEHGYRSLSEAMVNFRATFKQAEAAQVIQLATHQELIRVAKRLFYPERNYPAVIKNGLGVGLPERELQALRDWLPRGALNQKRGDAIEMLRLMNHRRAEPPMRVTYRLEHTVYWDEATRQAASAKC